MYQTRQIQGEETASNPTGIEFLLIQNGNVKKVILLSNLQAEIDTANKNYNMYIDKANEYKTLADLLVEKKEAN